MNSTIIGEPFQLYLSSNLARKKPGLEAIYATHNPDFPDYVTVTAQGEGVHIWDSLHAVASYSVNEHNTFAVPTYSLYFTEDGSKLIISYALVLNAVGLPEEHRGRTIWVIRQKISGSAVVASQRTAILIETPPVQICGTGHNTVPLLFVSKNGGLFLLNAQVDIKSQLDWPGEREHLKTFVFPRKSCTFIQENVDSCTSVAVTCCQAGMILHVRLVLLGEEIVPVRICEIPVASSTKNDIIISGLTCSPSGVLSFIDSRGIWVTYQLSMNSPLVSASISENIRLRRMAMLNREKPITTRDAISIASLGTSLVFLAALVEGVDEISLQVWDLSYNVLLATQSMSIPSAITSPHVSLTVANEGQMLLAVSPSSANRKRVAPKRCSIHIIPVDARLKSSIATALRRMALTAEWSTLMMLEPQEDDKSAGIIPKVQTYLKLNNAQKAEKTFLEWVNSQTPKEAALGHEFVKKVFNIVFPPKPPAKYAYAPRITRCLLENAVVSTIMLNGHLITMLRQRGDWENLMFALTTVADVSEDELMASVKFLIDEQRRRENADDVDAQGGYIPPLWSYLFACVSYPFSAEPMRLAIRKYLPDARDLVMVLEILENWIQGGTEHEVEALLKSLATNTEMTASKADSPPFPKVISFLHALLDASFVALLQYQQSNDVLRRILSYIEPEIMFLDGLEPLRGVLDPFARAQLLKEKTDAPKESSAEWRKRKKQLEEQAGLSVGLYRLEELVI